MPHGENRATLVAWSDPSRLLPSLNPYHQPLIPPMPIRSFLTTALLLTLPVSATEVAPVFERVENHDFHPVREGFTFDRRLDKHGVADLADPDWKLRTLAVRDLVRAENLRALIAGLIHDDPDVRYLSAMALGIRKEAAATPTLAKLLATDPHSTVRSQAAIALGQIGDEAALPALRRANDGDDRDVTHQAAIAIHAIKSDQPATDALAEAWRALDPATFATARVGEPAPDFTLTDTDGRTWKLSDLRGKKAVALIWIFADWCPVCHGEFRELIELRDAFEQAGIQPVTLECHDLLPARIMVGKEIEPDYWFAEKPFHETYTEKIWWPHLVDRAATVGVRYDVQPMAFAVHAEYINRPTVALIDENGILRFLYQGTYWGDRPTIHEVLKMMKTGNYNYPAAKRLKPATPSP